MVNSIETESVYDNCKALANLVQAATLDYDGIQQTELKSIHIDFSEQNIRVTVTKKQTVHFARQVR